MSHSTGYARIEAVSVPWKRLLRETWEDTLYLNEYSFHVCHVELIDSRGYIQLLQIKRTSEKVLEYGSM